MAHTWVNTPLVSQIQFPSGNTYYIKDEEARSVLEQLIADLPVEIQSAIADAMIGGFRVESALPTASAETMGAIYLIPGQSGSGDNTKIEYVTIRSGSDPNYTYSWEELGTTELDLSNLGALAYKDTVTLSKGAGDNVLGESTTFTAAASAVTFSGGTTDTFVKSVSAETSNKLVTTSIPNVTSAGAASTWSFAMGTGNDAETLIISGGNGTAPTLGSSITAATGAVASNGAGASVVTGITIGSSASAVTSVGTATAAAQTITVGTNDKVSVAKYGDLSVSVS